MTDSTRTQSVPIQPDEITPEHVYLTRRDFLKMAGLLGAFSALAACAPGLSLPGGGPTATPPVGIKASKTTDELGAALNTYEQITNYNNYYEFSLGKEEVANLAKDFKASPWQVQVYGLVNNPKTYGIDDLLKRFPQEERIYRLRCVEAWSMVIPWTGFSLASLLKEVDPLSSAKYVRFETVKNLDQMPGQADGSFPWPYQEGLRLDEAMNDLTILATGLYGKPLPNQDGAPLRLVVPWKYGFKSGKALIKIELVSEQPATFWSSIAPDEYGFYANVNPNVPHPRWSQDSERRIGEASRRATLMFNGYADQVAHLYDGMDLAQYY
jgi:methionine sulfoxide reductase catalytic subunit